MALAATLGSETLQIINKCKVLVVGAGGIGCELLKNLVSSGFKDIETIDLDTIEVSNLNRQFLFRKCHVGKSKAKTASAAVKQFDSSITIQGHLGNIKSSDFDTEYFNKFDIVLNALDNTEARRHVNRLCLSTKKSFVESGTQGFVGQVIPVIPKVTQCWECTPKQSNQRTYPVCTIRSTPDKPVHCIVWAKLIFNLFFGVTDDANIIKDLKVERKESEKITDFARNTFIYLFETDILEQLSMEEKWKNRSAPKCIKLSEIKQKMNGIKVDNGYDKRKVFNIEENACLFMHTMSALLERKGKDGELVFDKDDSLGMSFVSCAANLRMYCYGIDRKSEFATKGIAGNIIHAIATTNAIVAGAMIVQAIHILKRNAELGRMELKESENEVKSENCEDITNLHTKVCWVQSMGRKWLYPQNMETPNNKCFICQKSVVHLTLKSELFTYGSFVKQILQKRLGFKSPDITIECVEMDKSGKKLCNYLESITDEDDEEERKEKEVLLGKALSDSAIKIYDKSALSIEDFSQDVNVNLVVHYLDLNEEKHANGFEITNEWSVSKFCVKEKEESKEETSNKENNANGQKKRVNKHIGKKRKEMNAMEGANENNDEPPVKRVKT